MNFMIQKILPVLISRDWCIEGDVIAVRILPGNGNGSKFDGSFYTETEMTGLYVDGKTTRIK